MRLANTGDRPGETGRATLAGCKRRRAASPRMQPLPSGHRDPWQPWSPERLSDVQLDAYATAAEHLLNLNLPPAPNIGAMRRLWRRGGAGQRLAVRIAERWELAG